MARFTFQLIPLKQNNKMTLMLLIQHENEISIVFTFYFYSNMPPKNPRRMVWDFCFVYLFLILWFLDLLEAVEEILPSLPEDLSVWAVRDSVPRGVMSLTEKLRTASDKPMPRSHHVASNLKTPSLYIFTSGTTGVTHFFLNTQKESNSVGHISAMSNGINLNLV